MDLKQKKNGSNHEMHTHKKENNSEAIIIIPLLLFLYLLPVSINPILPLSKTDLRGPLIRQE